MSSSPSSASSHTTAAATRRPMNANKPMTDVESANLKVHRAKSCAEALYNAITLRKGNFLGVRKNKLKQGGQQQGVCDDEEQQQQQQRPRHHHSSSSSSHRTATTSAASTTAVEFEWLSYETCAAEALAFGRGVEEQILGNSSKKNNHHDVVVGVCGSNGPHVVCALIGAAIRGFIITPLSPTLNTMDCLTVALQGQIDVVACNASLVGRWVDAACFCPHRLAVAVLPRDDMYDYYYHSGGGGSIFNCNNDNATLLQNSDSQVLALLSHSKLVRSLDPLSAHRITQRILEFVAGVLSYDDDIILSSSGCSSHEHEEEKEKEEERQQNHQHQQPSSSFRPRSPSSISTIVFTSGSSGSIKGAAFSDAIWKQRFMAVPRYMQGVRILLHESVAWMTGFGALINTICVGGEIALPSTAHGPSQLLEEVEGSLPNKFSSVPLVWAALKDRFDHEVEMLRAAKTRSSHHQNQHQNKSSYESHNDPCRRSVIQRFQKAFAAVGKFLVGGAASSSHVLDWLFELFGSRVYESYGTTETGMIAEGCLSAAATAGKTSSSSSFLPHHSAPVMRSPSSLMMTIAHNVDFKLRDCPEFGYRTFNKPHARGELLVKTEGAHASKYTRDDGTTADRFTPDGYFCTGDVVELHGARDIRIIDRIGNIIKLQQGVFVAPGPLSEFYSQCPAVSQVHIHASARAEFVVALVVPSVPYFASHVDSIFGLDDDGDEKKPANDVDGGGAAAATTPEMQITQYQDLLEPTTVMPKVVAHIEQELRKLGRKSSSQKQPHEIPRSVALAQEPFTTANGLLTSSEKPARGAVEARYADVFQSLLHPSSSSSSSPSTQNMPSSSCCSSPAAASSSASSIKNRQQVPTRRSNTSSGDGGDNDNDDADDDDAVAELLRSVGGIHGTTTSSSPAAAGGRGGGGDNKKKALHNLSLVDVGVDSVQACRVKQIIQRNFGVDVAISSLVSPDVKIGDIAHAVVGRRRQQQQQQQQQQKTITTVTTRNKTFSRSSSGAHPLVIGKNNAHRISWEDERQLPPEMGSDETVEHIRKELLSEPSSSKTETETETTTRRRRRRREVLLVGATGFLGRYILMELLLLTPELAVTCLVRGPNADARLHAALVESKLELPASSKERLVVIEQEEEEVKEELSSLPPPLHLPSPQVYQHLNRTIDIVINAASKVDYVSDYSRCRASNVTLVKQLLSFCFNQEGKVKALHQISTTSVLHVPRLCQSFHPPAACATTFTTSAFHHLRGGQRNPRRDDGCLFPVVLDEGSWPAGASLADETLDNASGYVSSKLIAEELCFAAMQHQPQRNNNNSNRHKITTTTTSNSFSKLPISIHRVGMIGPSSKTGACQHHNFVTRIFGAMVQTRSCPSDVPASVALVLSPVDFVAKNIVTLVDKCCCCCSPSGNNNIAKTSGEAASSRQSASATTTPTVVISHHVNAKGGIAFCAAIDAFRRPTKKEEEEQFSLLTYETWRKEAMAFPTSCIAPLGFALRERRLNNFDSNVSDAMTMMTLLVKTPTTTKQQQKKDDSNTIDKDETVATMMKLTTSSNHRGFLPLTEDYFAKMRQYLVQVFAEGKSL